MTVPELTGQKTCTKCRESKPLDQFGPQCKSPDGLHPWCRACQAEAKRRYRQTNPEAVRESDRRKREKNPGLYREIDRRKREQNPELYREIGRRWREANPERAREIQREASRRWQQENPELRQEAVRRWREANPELVREHDRRKRERLRAAVFGHYGRKCACCGTMNDLSIDHIAGNGKEHRLELFGDERKSGDRMLRWMIKQGFPDGFQTLCMPCNTSKHDGPACRIDHAAARTA